jgi:hypothetical protein
MCAGSTGRGAVNARSPRENCRGPAGLEPSRRKAAPLLTDAERTHPPRRRVKLNATARPVGTARQTPAGRNPVRTIPIVLHQFHDWSRPCGSRYQHGFSTRSGNDGK